MQGVQSKLPSLKYPLSQLSQRVPIFPTPLHSVHSVPLVHLLHYDRQF